MTVNQLLARLQQLRGESGKSLMEARALEKRLAYNIRQKEASTGDVVRDFCIVHFGLNLDYELDVKRLYDPVGKVRKGTLVLVQIGSANMEGYYFENQIGFLNASPILSFVKPMLILPMNKHVYQEDSDWANVREYFRDGSIDINTGKNVSGINIYVGSDAEARVSKNQSLVDQLRS